MTIKKRDWRVKSVQKKKPRKFNFLNEYEQEQPKLKRSLPSQMVKK